MDKFINELEKFGFSNLEAKIYIALLKNPNINGSQISKILKSSRSAVYNSLNNLYEKGAVFMLPGEIKLYKAENPEILIENLKNDYMETAKSLKDGLSFLNAKEKDEQYWNIQGYEGFVLKAKEMLLDSKEEVYINTNYNLNIFRDELKILNERGVRIILFSFEIYPLDGIQIEAYYKDAKEHCPYKRMMLVTDYKKTLIGSGKDDEFFLGTFTENELLVSIISEHIHHDVYIYKWEEKTGSNLVNKDMVLDSLMEKIHSQRRTDTKHCL